MTEKKENTSPGSSPIFENEYAYVTQEGDIRLKKNSFFEERSVATVDPGSIEAKVEALEQSFDELHISADAFFADLEKEGFSEESTEESYNELLNKIRNAEAIGDFESLIEEVQSRFDRLRHGESSGSSVESADAADEGPGNSEITNEGKALSKASEPVVQKESEVVEGPADTADDAEDAEEAETEEKASEPVVQKESEVVEGPSDTADDAEDAEEAETEEKASEPVVQKESEVVEGPAHDTEDAQTPASEEKEKQELNEVEVYYKELAEKAETLSEMTDWSYATMEFDNLDHLWGEGPDPEGVEIKPYKNRIDELREELEEKKRAHYEEQKKIREANLARKKELLEELGEIIEKEQWTKTRAVARIKGRWDNIRSVPAESQEKMENEFQGLLTTFDEHKVDRLVKQKQNEEDNLTGKLIILEKMEQLSAEIPEEGVDWNELDKSLNNLARQFRKIGRVPADRNQDIWARFHKAQDDFHAARFKGDDKYRKNIEKYLSRKKKLIDEAETLVDMDNIAKAARKVNKLHRQWKKAGNLPQKEENELWDRFKAATDAFNEKKSENIDLLRDQEDENYTKKKALIQSAEELKESEEWETAHKEFQQLMEKWKGIGPVPRRKSGKIWKEFKGTMDYFYDRRREHFKEIKEERKDNLKEKEEVLEKLRNLTQHENPVEAVELAKPLQEEFKKAGYVPIKHKNRMWKEYREICDVIYDRFRAAKSAAQIVGKENVENFSVDDITEIKNKQEHAGRVRREIQSLTSDLIQMKESLSYFKPSGSDSSVLDEVRGRIDKAEQRIREKEEQLEEIEIEIDKMKRDV